MSVHKLSTNKMSSDTTSSGGSSSGSIETEARQWLIRLDGDTALSQVDQAALKAWAGRSPAHHQELVRISAFWNESNVLTELSIPLQASVNQTVKEKQKHQQAEQKSWGGFWAGVFGSSHEGANAGINTGANGIAAIVAIVNALTDSMSKKLVLSVATTALLVVVVINGPLSTISATDTNGIYVTAIGEVLSQPLADGTILNINTDSQVQVDYSESVRKIRLLRGEAHFAVAHNKTWPFEVYAGKGRVKAVGTAFSVQLSDDMVEVLVSEGRVDLAAVVHNTMLDAGVVDSAMVDDAMASSVISDHEKIQQAKIYTPVLETIGSLDVGQQARFYNRALTANGNSVDAEAVKSLIKQIDTFANEELERRLAWRSGYLVFAGEPLEQVVEEINRYTPMQVEISDAALRNIKIGGRFKVGELDAMLSVFETSFSIRVSRLDDQSIQLLAK